MLHGKLPRRGAARNGALQERAAAHQAAAPAGGEPEIRVAAFVPYPADSAPSQRFRIEQWAPHLARQGIRVDLLPFADAELMRRLYRPGIAAKAARLLPAFVRRLRETAGSRRYDAILVHRAACLGGPPIVERRLAASGRPLLYDFDDALFLPHSNPANRRFAWLKFPGKTAELCRISRHVVAGNAYLADYARRHNPAVTVIPTSVDTDAYRPAERAAGSGARVVIGWTGSSTSQAHLEAFAPVLRELVRRRDVELRVTSDREPVLPGLPVTWTPWSADVAAEAAELARFDIGIMPIPDDPWTRGKCAAKALLYMAMGVPAVCSAVGANRELIEDGRNGLLATTPEEWLLRLEALVDDAPLRRRLGAAGRATVEQRYSASRCASQLAEVVRQCVAAAPGAKAAC